MIVQHIHIQCIYINQAWHVSFLKSHDLSNESHPKCSGELQSLCSPLGERLSLIILRHRTGKARWYRTKVVWSALEVWIYPNPHPHVKVLIRSFAILLAHSCYLLNHLFLRLLWLSCTFMANSYSLT